MTINLEELLKKNISRLFLVPTLGIPKEYLEAAGIVNSFLIDSEENNEPLEDNKLFVLFKITDREYFNSLLDVVRTKNIAIILEERDYPDDYVLIVFKLKEGLEEDYIKIVEGKYSKTSVAFRNRIPKEVVLQTTSGRQTIKTTQHRFFDKDEDMRKLIEKEYGVTLDQEDELWTKLNLNNETFRIKDYIKQ